MNIERLKTTENILIRNRYGKFNICNFRAPLYVDDLRVAESEEALHKCGYSACIMGYVAVSPEWKELGGKVRLSGVPEINELSDEYSIYFWFEAETDEEIKLIDDLCVLGGLDGITDSLKFYNVQDLEDITIEIAINKLTEIIEKLSNNP